MDPNTIFVRWLSAVAAVEYLRSRASVWPSRGSLAEGVSRASMNLRELAEEKREHAAEAAEELLSWLRRGGFEPQWTERQRAMFFDQTGGL